MKLALVGATGLVGREMIQVLQEFNIKPDVFIPAASEKSVGKTITFNQKEYSICSVADALAQKPDFALFSAGGTLSTEWAPKFVEAGCTVIDNSSAWRMDPNIALVVPEINLSAIKKQPCIIANPNCSTIQLVLALAPLHQRAQIDRLVVSTYQSVTGTGAKAIAQLNAEENNELADKAYHYPIYRNVIPHCDVFLDNGYTKEEMKVVNETRKILGDDSLKITCTAVRVPVVGGHSESVNVSFKNPISITEIRQLLSEMPGIQLVDDPSKNQYPMPMNSHGKNEVLVGRIRHDESQENTFNLWIVADNLRKGAATNAVQILKALTQNP
jgi:aspartate-semialdehyde dehydrogenase